MQPINHNRRWVDHDAQRRAKFKNEFDPFSLSAGVDRDFDDAATDMDYIADKLRSRGSL